MSTEKEKKGGFGKAGIIVLVILIIALIVTIVVLIVKGRNQTISESELTKSEEKRSVVISEENAEEIINDMVNSQDDEPDAKDVAYYSATMNYEWRFPTGSSPSSNAYVENNLDNSTDVYFDLFLKGNEDEAIYESPIIPVGSSISKFSLTKNLDAGTYECICIYHLVDEEQNTLSTLRVTVTVIVEQ